MTFSHDQIRDHLVDFLAGELAGEARAAFEAHVSGCEACRGEVRGFERAHSLARDLVRAPLAEAVPSRVRARVLEAAASAAKQSHARSTVTTSARATTPARRSGWLARWFDRRNARWTFPTFATVAAMAAFLLVRETVFREAKHPLSEAPVAKVAPPLATPAVGPAGRLAAPALAPSPPAEAYLKAHPSEARGPTEVRSGGKHHRGPERDRASSSDASAAPANGTITIDDGLEIGPTGAERKIASEREEASGRGAGVAKGNLADRLTGGVSRGGGGTSRDAPLSKSSKKTVEKADGALAKVPAKGDVDDLMEGFSGSSSRRDRAADKDQSSAARAPQKRSAQVFDDESDPDGVSAAPKSAARPNAATSRAPEPSARSADDRPFAIPPPAPRPAPSVIRATAPANSGDGATLRAPPPPAPARPPAAAPSAPEAPRDAEKSSASAGPPSARTPTSEVSSATQAPSADPVPLLAARAEKLMVARRFSEAAAAYRELLRRFPGHASAPAWRKRLATAEAAVAADGTGFASPPPSR